MADDHGLPKLNATEIKLTTAILFHGNVQINVDWNEIAEIVGLKNGKTASTTWGVMKKKVAKVGEGDGSATASIPQKRRNASKGDAEKAMPTKRGKKAQTDSKPDDAITGANGGVKPEPDY